MFLFEIIILRLYQLIIKSVFRFNVVRSKKKKITQRNSKRFQYKDNNTLIRLYDNLYLRCLREYKLFQTYFEHSFYTHLRINFFFFFLFKRSRRNFVPHVIHDIFLISTSRLQQQHFRYLIFTNLYPCLPHSLFTLISVSKSDVSLAIIIIIIIIVDTILTNNLYRANMM